jgi:hypothetical protein
MAKLCVRLNPLKDLYSIALRKLRVSRIELRLRRKQSMLSKANSIQLDWRPGGGFKIGLGFNVRV